MLKRIVLSFALLSMAQLAHASPETAENWGERAEHLHITTLNMLNAVEAGQPTNLNAIYIDELTRFAITAGRLAIWVDETGGAKDFGCIYRGMAEEAELQLYALEDAPADAAAITALNRIASMLADAQMIAIASAHAARTRPASEAPGQCTFNTSALSDYLEN